MASPIRIGLVGFGRIGRNIFRHLHARKDMRIVAINDIFPHETLAYLLKWDTVHGPFPEDVVVKGNTLVVAGQSIQLTGGRQPGDVDWQAHKVDVVIEASTRYRTRADLQRHLDRGAKRIILTVPPESGEDIDIVVPGVNDPKLQLSTTMISSGSVTINCIAPVLKLLHQEFKIRHAAMTSVHAYTSNQRLADVPSDSFRSSRSAAGNIIPAPTSAPEIIGQVLPDLAGKLQGMAMNVPIPDGSVVDLVCEFEKPVTQHSINDLVQSAATSEQYKHIIEYTDQPIVSSDVIGNPHSAIFDGLATKVLGDSFAKTLIWFDNGWGHAARIVELVERLASLKTKRGQR